MTNWELKWGETLPIRMILILFGLNLCTSVAANEKEEVVFNESPEFQGDRLFLTMGTGCYTIAPDWSNRISSVDTKGSCVIGWDQSDCKGLSVKLQDKVENLARLRFDNKISSISACPSRVVIRKDDDNPKNSDCDCPCSESSNAHSLDIWRTGLIEHNKYRRIHGVPNLMGDVDLHHEAQGHADYLAKNNLFEASPVTQYGENLATSYKQNKVMAIRDVVKRWYDKIDFYDFNDPESNKRRPKSGQFSNIVWKSTTHLGVGVAWNDEGGKWIVVCMYSPPATKNRYRENVPLPSKRMEAEGAHLFTTVF